MQRGKKPRHEPPEITLERERAILEWRINERASYPKIAQRFTETYQDTISGAQISRILKKHREAYLHDSKDLIEQEFIEQNELINLTISEALIGWKDSRNKKRKVVKTVETGTDAKSGNEYDKSIETLEEEEQAGDPRFLKLLIDASTRKAKLWGLDAAPKSATKDEDEEDDGSQAAAEGFKRMLTEAAKEYGSRGLTGAAEETEDA